MDELQLVSLESSEIATWDFPMIKAELQRRLDAYAGLVYTDETIKDAKSDRATLNKVKKAITDAEKAYKAKCLEPYEALKPRIKELVDLVEEQRIVDYKTGSKPDIEGHPERVEHYRKQLEIYAYLIEKRYGKKVRKMHLYYTSTLVGNPIITFEWSRASIDETVAEISETIKKIESRDFSGSVTNNYACKFCDMRYVKDARQMWEVTPDFMKFVGELVLVGFNSVRFDSKFLARAGRYSNIIISNKHFDVMRYAQKFSGQLGLDGQRINLPDLSDKLEIENPRAHRALADAITTARVYLKLNTIIDVSVHMSKNPAQSG